MDSSVLTILSVILALAGTICMFIMILPEKARPGLNPFLKYIHDLFNFKVLWLEQILKFIYTFTTLLVLVFGFLCFIIGPFYDSELMTAGLTIMIGGPIAIRIIYESFMLFIILVRNSNSINRKMGKEAEAEKLDYSAPAPRYAAPVSQPVEAAPAQEEPSVFCPFCGTKQSAENNNCIQCGQRIKGI